MFREQVKFKVVFLGSADQLSEQVEFRCGCVLLLIAYSVFVPYFVLAFDGFRLLGADFLHCFIVVT